MNESIISVRYSKALFNLAKEKSVIEAIKQDMETVFSLMKESEALQYVFQNPVLKPSKKNEVVKKIFTSFNPISLSFIELLIKNHREEYLFDISRNFLDKYMQHKGIETAVFTSVNKVDEAILEKVKKLIQTLLKKDVELSNVIDNRILGGFILRVGDKQFDASVQSKLNKIKQKLVKTSVH
jgi:F-type H+-transporting ATPase subunit delta